MSAAMGFALSLLGRANDELLHVLTTEAFQNSKSFYPKKNDAPCLQLIDVPFVRLRTRLELDAKKKTSYMNLVEEAQKTIDMLVKLPECVIDVTTKSLIIGHFIVALKPLELALYIFFTKQNQLITFSCEEDSQTYRSFKDIYRRVTKRTSDHSKTLSDIGEFRRSVSTIKKAIRNIITHNHLADRYIIQSEGPQGEKRHGFSENRPKFKIQWPKK